tara:strand:- start:429 stop:701 length:273 start_codon:yes stop_codon:yes gene_type:complete
MSKTRELYAPSNFDEEQCDLSLEPDEQSDRQQILDKAEWLGAAYEEVMRMIREDQASNQELQTFVDEVERDLAWLEERQYSQPENEKPRG